MKRIIILFLTLYYISTINCNGQDLMTEQPLETKLYSCETENTEFFKADRKIKFHILYSAYIPIQDFTSWGEIGFSFVVIKKLGGYISGGYNLEEDELKYLTGGVLRQIISNMSIYGGVGLTDSQSGIIGTGGFYSTNYFGIETGLLLNIKFISLEAGLGSSIFSVTNGWGYEDTDFVIGKRVFTKLGIGINF